MTEDIKKRISMITAGEVPEGYEKKKLGIMPIEWQNKPMKKVVIPIKDKAGNRQFETLSISAGKGFVNQAEKFGKEMSGAQYVNYTVIQNGDFSYNKGNSKKYPQGCIYMMDDRETAAVPNVFNSFRIKDSNPQYYKHLFISGFMNKQLFRLINSGVRNDGLLNLYDDDFYNCYLPVPRLPEQNKIALILTTCDRVIDLKEKLIAEKLQQKKWLQQMLLTGKIRLKTFCDEWQKIRLDEICDITTGKLDANAATDDGEYPFFTCAKQNSSINNYAFDCEAIIIAGNGDVGHTKLYKGRFNAYQRTYVLNNISRSAYMVKLYIDKYLPKVINMELQQGAMPYIKMGTLQNLAFKYPVDDKEETKICNILSTTDSEVFLVKKELAEWKQKKKALMQLLLIGKVRVKI